MTDRKTLDRVQKLLNLARNGGATEAEAASALSRAQAIMAENNLTMSALEAAGNVAEGGARLTNNTKGRAAYKWQQRLMFALAQSNMTLAIVDQAWNSKLKRHLDVGYTVIGREANVIATLNMFDYLVSTVERIVPLESNSSRLSRSAMSWKEGCGARLGERVRERAYQIIAEQKAQAATTPTGPTANGLVIVLEDVVKSEAHANRDARYGWAPGTSLARSAEYETQRTLSASLEEQRRSGLTQDQRDAEDAKEAAEAAKNQAKWDRKSETRSRNYWKVRDIDAFLSGRDAAETVGLDEQVAAEERHALK